MVIAVLCIIDGIVGCALGDCNFFVFLSRRGSFGLDGLYPPSNFLADFGHFSLFVTRKLPASKNGTTILVPFYFPPRTQHTKEDTKDQTTM